jgi:hypothetical protein
MNANRRGRLTITLSLLAVLAGGCGWARQITWELPPRDEPRDTWRDATYDTQRDDPTETMKAIRDERARNEAEFRTANPGALPGARR